MKTNIFHPNSSNSYTKYAFFTSYRHCSFIYPLFAILIYFLILFFHILLYNKRKYRYIVFRSYFEFTGNLVMCLPCFFYSFFDFFESLFVHLDACSCCFLVYFFHYCFLNLFLARFAVVVVVCCCWYIWTIFRWELEAQRGAGGRRCARKMKNTIFLFLIYRQREREREHIRGEKLSAKQKSPADGAWWFFHGILLFFDFFSFFARVCSRDYIDVEI